MKKSILLFFAFTLLSLALTACKQDDPKTEEKNQVEANTTNNDEEYQKKEVKGVKIHDPSEDADSPSTAILQQFEVLFKNGESEYPKESDVISETFLGDKSILTIHSPEGKNNFGVFLYEKEGKWKIRGIIRIDANKGESFTDKDGLSLPMDHYRATNLDLEKNSKTWTFVKKDKIVTISKFKRFSFDGGPDTEEVNLKDGIKGYISKDKFGNSSLYYFDRGNLIVLSGNLNKTEATKLAKSLPASTNLNFPKSVK
ncbi:DUF4367 domain-containing protein [Tuberibacillus sp. Marseille-P3662]|uniref:DUF4367 domain-containing protein n=1 Tax=Tuberibacillus sp. Marseille-P3662 TaxID=1965358 RepID=UPI000A1CD926|nr:DUF4367 domain-containing protein [Tuberibacillus sp. Marseille-P3662]